MKNRKSFSEKPETKNEKLNKKRSMFFQIGVILSLAIVLAAFEWTTVRTHTYTDWDLGDNIDIESMAPITKHETPKPKPKPVIQTSIIEIIDNESQLEEAEIIFEEPEDGLNDPLMIIEDEGERETEESIVFKVAETQPSFPGGTEALYKFLYGNIRYPELARETGIQGTVYVQFVVWNDGSIRNISLERGIGGGCDEEALRVIRMMPDWNPGLQRTKPVNVQMVLPIKFVLK